MSKSNLASKIKPSSSTDWARVKRDVTADVPLTVVKAFEPYDPEDAQAVDAFWDKADLKRLAAESGVRGSGGGGALFGRGCLPAEARPSQRGEVHGGGGGGGGGGSGL